jgi:hypothetical protein
MARNRFMQRFDDIGGSIPAQAGGHVFYNESRNINIDCANATGVVKNPI